MNAMTDFDFYRWLSYFIRLRDWVESIDPRPITGGQEQ